MKQRKSRNDNNNGGHTHSHCIGGGEEPISFEWCFSTKRLMWDHDDNKWIAVESEYWIVYLSIIWVDLRKVPFPTIHILRDLMMA